MGRAAGSVTEELEAEIERKTREPTMIMDWNYYRAMRSNHSNMQNVQASLQTCSTLTDDYTCYQTEQSEGAKKSGAHKNEQSNSALKKPILVNESPRTDPIASQRREVEKFQRLIFNNSCRNPKGLASRSVVLHNQMMKQIKDKTCVDDTNNPQIAKSSETYIDFQEWLLSSNYGQTKSEENYSLYEAPHSRILVKLVTMI